MKISDAIQPVSPKVMPNQNDPIKGAPGARITKCDLLLKSVRTEFKNYHQQCAIVSHMHLHRLFFLRLLLALVTLKHYLNPETLLRLRFSILEILLYGFLALLARLKFGKASLVEGIPYFLEQECYIRLIRARNFLEDGSWFQRFHRFENFPEGIVSSLTSGPDWVIAATAMLFSGDAVTSLARAGWWVGPLCGALFTILLVILSRPLPPHFKWGRHLFLITFAIAPVLAWTGGAGRPGEAMLVSGLFALALLFELRRWHEPSIFTPIAAGICWGGLLWISLWEAGLMLIALTLFNLSFRGWERWWTPAGAAVLGIFLWSLERFPTHGAMLVSGPEAARWMQMLPAVQPTPATFWLSAGLGLPVVIAFFFKNRPRETPPAAGVWIGLTAACALLALWQLRWFPFFVTLAGFLIMNGWPHLSRNWKVTAAVLQILPLLVWNVIEWNRLQPLQTSQALSQALEAIPENGPVLGPPKHSGQIAFETGSPVVAGPSPQSLPGILETARFYTTDDFRVADQLLRERNVKWIIVTRPDSLIAESAELLGKEAGKLKNNRQLVTWRLWDYKALPESFQIRYASQRFKIYQYHAAD